MDDHYAFLYMVKTYVEQHPTVAPQVVAACQQGLEFALEKSMERAADMEVALSSQLFKMKNRDSLTLDKLKKWQGKSAVVWDSYIATHSLVTAPDQTEMPK